MSKCLRCRRDAVDDKDSFRCDGCKRLLHVACANVTSTEVRCLQLAGGRKLKFFCDDCENGLLQIPVLKTMMKELQSEIKDLKNAYASLIADKDNHISGLKSEIESLKMRGTSNISFETMFEELNERQIRSNNIMIYNVKESSSEEISERIEADKKEVSKIMQKMDMSEATNNSIMKILRVGRAGGPKHRPVKVVFSNNQIVKQLLKSKMKLLSTPIRISDDQTRMQQDMFKKLHMSWNLRKPLFSQELQEENLSDEEFSDFSDFSDIDPDYNNSDSESSGVSRDESDEDSSLSDGAEVVENEDDENDTAPDPASNQFKFSWYEYSGNHQTLRFTGNEGKQCDLSRGLRIPLPSSWL
ncbi:unnamed protein product [Phaedon cochleariae]|uniref:Zinc finger PHD-type domain-containing protein n=1 Tax=Phaedon cochleariae TaxID=80249 RepID=A0A9N9SF72_PHACE|nr:unnamed protein product [Phaedon cochleariae]